MYAIAAVSRNLGIGLGNDLLFTIPEDMKFFRLTTTGHTIVLGRKNLESFPGRRPLPNRRHLVLTGQADYTAEGCEIFHDLPSLLQAVSGLAEEDVWVCGGGMVYRELLPYCHGALLTEIDAEPEADTFFPDLSADPAWVQTEAGEWKEYEGLRYRFCTWKNSLPKSLDMAPACSVDSSDPKSFDTVPACSVDSSDPDSSVSPGESECLRADSHPSEGCL